MFSSTFGGSWFWPILGIIFLPFTTLMYVLLWTPVNGVGGFDWVWLGRCGSRELQRPRSHPRRLFQEHDRLTSAPPGAVPIPRQGPNLETLHGATIGAAE